MKEKLSPTAQNILEERFGQDSLIALATVSNGIPYVRKVNAYYEGGAFYVITHGLSNKMDQIARNSNVAIAADWFTAHGIGENLGYIYKKENLELSKKLESVFASWFHNGHNDYSDPNTCILCIHLTDSTLFSHGKRFEIDFTI